MKLKSKIGKCSRGQIDKDCTLIFYENEWKTFQGLAKTDLAQKRGLNHQLLDYRWNAGLRDAKDFFARKRSNNRQKRLEIDNRNRLVTIKNKETPKGWICIGYISPKNFNKKDYWNKIEPGLITKRIEGIVQVPLFVPKSEAIEKGWRVV